MNAQNNKIIKNHGEIELYLDLFYISYYLGINMSRREKTGAKTNRKYTTVSIPYTLYEKIRNFIKGTGFKSVSDFVTWLLREFFVAIEEEKKEKTSKVQDRIIKALQALGYL